MNSNDVAALTQALWGMAQAQEAVTKARVAMVHLKLLPRVPGGEAKVAAVKVDAIVAVLPAEVVHLGGGQEGNIHGLPGTKMDAVGVALVTGMMLPTTETYEEVIQKIAEALQ